MTNSVVDLRSDTVTRPSAGMRAALAAAAIYALASPHITRYKRFAQWINR